MSGKLVNIYLYLDIVSVHRSGEVLLGIERWYDDFNLGVKEKSKRLSLTVLELQKRFGKLIAKIYNDPTPQNEIYVVGYIFRKRNEKNVMIESHVRIYKPDGRSRLAYDVENDREM